MKLKKKNTNGEIALGVLPRGNFFSTSACQPFGPRREESFKSGTEKKRGKSFLLADLRKSENKYHHLCGGTAAYPATLFQVFEGVRVKKKKKKRPKKGGKASRKETTEKKHPPDRPKI